MTEEEKKAIESLKVKIEFMGDNYYKIMSSQAFNDLRKETKVALNLIEKQTKEIEELNKQYDQLTQYFIKNHVAKDKIREKREQEEKLLESEIAYGVIKYREGKVQALKELLEEE